MGDLSAMSSIARVLETHGDQIREEWAQQVPQSIRGTFTEVMLDNEVHGIRVSWKFQDGSLGGPVIDIDELAEEYPDCEVGR